MDTTALLNEKAKVYGDPVATHVRIAEMWSSILDHEVNAHEVALMMMGLKLIRAANAPDYEDSLVDVHGYADIAQMIMGHREALDV